ncbi:MAG: helix-turn-helix transcriptional regulator [Opitutus sp.]|nr:helix-turn-helix transcriptional regulator [Opitutus sp.]MCS6246262.1 helix-turn-helix transcriptional regulator [Opitutus sp.]MCS6273795.1 helix-turn-helix transcriptional regulator [Opitutus sp.]MCS6277269.1 helix-turn-helix transcriptional regulator [Opitutus sp.]MCS6300391.1 helix-turn-helix transcriptional regulator [Opitutus sp.]
MIRKLRNQSPVAITQEALVSKLQMCGLQIDRSALARIENGERLVRDSEIIALAAALRVPIQRLFE